MKKSDAIKLFGDIPALADAMGVSAPAIYEWPEDLTRRISDRVVAALVRADRISEAVKVSEKIKARA